MRHKLYFAIPVLLALTGLAAAQESPPSVATSEPPAETAPAADVRDGASPTSYEPDTAPGVDQLLARPGLTLATASVSTKEKGAQLKTTFLPYQLVDSKYYWPISELRITGFADSDKSLSRLAVSTGYNPFSRRSDRAGRILKSVRTRAQCGDDFDKALTIEYDLHHANRAAAGADAAKVEEDDRHKEKLQALMDAHKRCVRLGTRAIWSDLNSGLVPSVFLTLSYDFFPYGEGPAPSDMTMTAPLEWSGGPSAQLSFEFRPCERANVSAWGTFKHVRSKGDVGTPKADYFGAGLTASLIAYSLLPDDVNRLPDSYLEDGFIPGIGVGLSIQTSSCTSHEDCDNGRTQQTSATPYVDILLSPSVQFRFALPITRFKSVSSDGTELSPTISISGGFSTL